MTEALKQKVTDALEADPDISYGGLVDLAMREGLDKGEAQTLISGILEEWRNRKNVRRRTRGDAKREVIATIRNDASVTPHDLVELLSDRYSEKTARNVVAEAISEEEKRTGQEIVLRRFTSKDGPISELHQMIGVNIKSQIVKMNLTEEQFLEQSKMGSRSYLNKMLNGRTDLRMSELNRVADALNTPVHKLTMPLNKLASKPAN